MTQHDDRVYSRVGWTIPTTHAETNSLRSEHPIRTWIYSARVTDLLTPSMYIALDELLLVERILNVMHQSVDQGHGQSVVHVKEFAPFPEGSIRDNHDRSDFITGGDNLEQSIGSTLVDGQIAQLIEEKKTAQPKIFSACVLMPRSARNKIKNETDFYRASSDEHKNQGERALPTR
jgi:hypothetical protein